MRVFLSAVLAILSLVLAGYTVDAWRAEQVRVFPRLSRGEARVITKASDPATYWTHMAIGGGTAVLALSMSLHQGRFFLRDRRKNA